MKTTRVAQNPDTSDLLNDKQLVSSELPAAGFTWGLRRTI
jgi:hypothetical protein